MRVESMVGPVEIARGQRWWCGNARFVVEHVGGDGEVVLRRDPECPDTTDTWLHKGRDKTVTAVEAPSSVMVAVRTKEGVRRVPCLYYYRDVRGEDSWRNGMYGAHAAWDVWGRFEPYDERAACKHCGHHRDRHWYGDEECMECSCAEFLLEGED